MENTTIHELWYFLHLLLLNINYLRYYFFQNHAEKKYIFSLPHCSKTPHFPNLPKLLQPVSGAFQVHF